MLNAYITKHQLSVCVRSYTACVCEIRSGPRCFCLRNRDWRYELPPVKDEGDDDDEMLKRTEWESTSVQYVVVVAEEVVENVTLLHAMNQRFKRVSFGGGTLP